MGTLPGRGVSPYLGGDRHMKEDRPKPGNKRNIIIKAAVQVFSQKGYHNTRMEEIALAAGIGKGTIYEYFQSKLQLFQEMLGQSMQLYYSSMSNEKLDQLTIDKKLSLILESHFRFCYEHHELTKMIFQNDIYDEELKEWSLKIHKEKEGHIQSLIGEGIAQGELKPMDVKLAALMVMGVIQSIWLPLVLGNWQVDPTVAANKMTALIMHGLAR